MFSTLASGCGPVKPLKVSWAARSFNLRGTPKKRTVSGPCHLSCTASHYGSKQKEKSHAVLTLILLVHATYIQVFS